MIRSLLLAFLSFLSGCMFAQCAPDYRSDPKRGVSITDIAVNGTTSLSSTELAALKSKLIGTCADDDNAQLEEVVRSRFQDQGYFAAQVENLSVRVVDPLSQPKQVALQTDVAEGQRYKLSEIRFVGNHALTGEELRAAFPLRKGAVFKRSEIAGSFDRVRKLYAQHGYGDSSFMPETQLGQGTVILTLTLDEGPQYHMGHFTVFGKPELADRFKSEWHLAEGAVFDLSYAQKYADANGFPFDEYIQLVTNCPKAIVDVQLILDRSDPELQSQPRSVKCPESGGIPGIN